MPSDRPGRGGLATAGVVDSAIAVAVVGAIEAAGQRPLLGWLAGGRPASVATVPVDRGMIARGRARVHAHGHG